MWKVPCFYVVKFVVLKMMSRDTSVLKRAWWSGCEMLLWKMNQVRSWEAHLGQRESVKLPEEARCINLKFAIRRENVRMTGLSIIKRFDEESVKCHWVNQIRHVQRSQRNDQESRASDWQVAHNCMAWWTLISWQRLSHISMEYALQIHGNDNDLIHTFWN